MLVISQRNFVPCYTTTLSHSHPHTIISSPVFPFFPLSHTHIHWGLTELNSYIELYVYPNITYIQFILLYALCVYFLFYFCKNTVFLHPGNSYTWRLRTFVHSFISMRCMSICTEYSTYMWCYSVAWPGMAVYFFVPRVSPISNSNSNNRVESIYLKTNF